MNTYWIKLDVKWISGRTSEEYFSTWMEANSYLHHYEHQMVKWTAHKA